jgi:DUF4097 and DUF4098 domain-containing protein YvlB
MLGNRPTKRAGRTAWLIGGSLFSIATLGWGTLNAVELLAHERTHSHLDVPASVRTVDLRGGDGSVRIDGTDGPAGVDVSVSNGLQAASHSEQVEGDRLVIRSSCPAFLNTWCSVNYVIRVPRSVVVTAHSSNGSITVAGIDGDLDVSTADGGVRVDGGVGQLRLHTSNGSVRGTGLRSGTVDASTGDGSIHLTFVTAPSAVTARSSNGNVTIDLPNTTDAYRLDTGTSNGSVTAPIRTDPTSDHTISAHTSNGSITIQYAA